MVDLIRKQSELERGELKQIDKELKEAKQHCIELKSDTTTLPTIDVAQIHNAVEIIITEMNNAKAELEKKWVCVGNKRNIQNL